MADVLQQTSFAPMPMYQPGTNEYLSVDQVPAFTFPPPMCPVHQREEGIGRDTASQTLTPASQPQKGHRRARTSVHTPTALPAFSFGAVTTDNEPSTPTSPQDAPSPGLLPPPMPTSRHRRAVSELVGEQSARHAISLPSTQPGTGISGFVVPPASARHRHRRSGAVSSQDLSALQRPLSIDQKSASPTTHSDATIPARAVEFSDCVDVIPRPQSIMSTSSGSSHSTLQAMGRSSTIEHPEQQSIQDPPSFPQHVSSEIPASLSDFVSESSMGIDIVELDEDFDNDPTATVISQSQHPSFDPAADPFTDLKPSTSTRSSPIELDSAAEDIDLDLAFVDDNPAPSRSPVRGVSFRRARASMHSAGGHANSFMAPGYQGHRRAESAPLLAPVSFGFRNGADIGQEMPAVFEDPEEDSPETPPQCTDTSDVQQSFDSSKTSSPAQDSTPRPLTARRAIHSSPTLLPPIEFLPSNPPRDEPSDDTTLHANDDGREALHLPKPAFVVTEEPSASSKSSPKYARSYISSSEPSPGLQHSVEDVPSLISCGSTIGSSTVQQNRPSLSAPSLDQDISKSTSSLAASTKARHHKRLSIMSMSMSKLFTTNSSRPDDAGPLEQQHHRSHSTAGLRPPSPTRPRRLSRILNMFRKKPSTIPISQS